MTKSVYDPHSDIKPMGSLKKLTVGHPLQSISIQPINADGFSEIIVATKLFVGYLQVTPSKECG